VHSS
jgi:hypothetical protein